MGYLFPDLNPPNHTEIRDATLTEQAVCEYLKKVDDKFINRMNNTMTDTSELLAEREKTHGRFADQARAAGRLKDVITEECFQRDVRGQPALSAQQREALDMIASKIGRIMAGDATHQDHILDMISYATLFAEVDETKRCLHYLR
jgi:hypothetical protein